MVYVQTAMLVVTQRQDSLFRSRYRLITANTIDQRILERAEAKRKLEKLVIHRGGFVPLTVNLAGHG